jgi:CubicO group peptidase (beta-lactamase class C family)
MRAITLSSLALIAGFSLAGHAQLANEAELNAYLSDQVDSTRIPGLVAMVVDDNRVLYAAAYGQRDVAGASPMQTDAIFRIASMTKPVAATAIMMLVEDGRLGLDDPISRYVPAFRELGVIQNFNAEDGSYSTRAANSGPTIRQLLSHSSGLAYGFASDVIARLSQENPGAGAGDLPLLYDPGTAWSYAGGIAVVGNVLERIEGMGLDTFLRERLFLPLGMHETSFIVAAPLHERVATVHRDDGAGLTEAPNPIDIRSAVSGDGGLHTSAADYARFIQFILNDGVAPNGERLLASASIREMSRNQLGDRTVTLQDEPLPNLARAFPLGAGRDGFGLGFQVTGDHASASERAPGSLSWAGIFNTEFWIDPASGIGGMLLMQYLPFYDPAAIETLQGFEARVYRGLAD